MFESEQQDQQKGKEPGREEKEPENAEANGSQRENDPASPAKDRIGNVAPVELPYGHQVKGCDKEAHPPRKCKRMKDEVCSLRNFTDDNLFEEGEQEGVSQSEGERL